VGFFPNYTETRSVPPPRFYYKLANASRKDNLITDKGVIRKAYTVLLHCILKIGINQQIIMLFDVLDRCCSISGRLLSALNSLSFIFLGSKKVSASLLSGKVQAPSSPFINTCNLQELPHCPDQSTSALNFFLITRRPRSEK
jgi:hypothetical protein